MWRAGIDRDQPTDLAAIERRNGFIGWDDDRMRVDTMRPLAENVAIVLEYLRRMRDRSAF